MSLKVVYVTVGTTKFDALIREVTSDKVLQTLKKRGCQQLVLQLGNQSNLHINSEQINARFGIEVEQYDFKFETLRSDIVKADLVIGHAGAGTCMDILNHHKPGIIVCNEYLMDNHQMELALQLANEGYVNCCVLNILATQIEQFDISTLKPYQQTTGMNKFVDYLNDMMS